MDILTIGGPLFAIGMILLGQHIEGGHPGSLLQLTAFIIVAGGTAGALMVSYPMKDFVAGLKSAKTALGNVKVDYEAMLKDLIEMAAVARRDGVLALEARIPSLEDPFMRRALQLMVDGVDAAIARDVLETELEHEAEESVVAAKFWESAGAFAPAIGILGAVLGLIHVMENLDNPAMLGPGIAVAFVATVYAVGIANIVFLPMGAKIKRKVAMEKQRKTIIAEGVLSIQEGLNPRILEEKLRSYMGHHAPAPAKK